MTVPLVSSPLTDHACQVVLNRDCGTGLKLLRLKSETGAFACQPGQFVMLDLPEQRFHFRRPFSVLDVPEPGVLDVYYKIVGAGTRLMAALTPGSRLRCLGPLGNAFPALKNPAAALLIGGGIGVAPLYFAAKTASQAGNCFYGVRSASEIGLQAELSAVFGHGLQVATDDGSAGFAGNVCQLLAQHPETIAQAEEALICGPTRMMEAAAAWLAKTNPTLNIYVSLEAHMPCGTGACTGCTVPCADQYLPAKVCVEGPVFEARHIQWDGVQKPLAAFLEGACPP